jgi:diguanylate cyclase (GGDEF)-like protein
MIDALLRYLAGRSSLQIFLLGILFVGGIGAIDQITGSELSFSIFYLLPILFVAWYGDQSSSYVICLVSMLVWFLIDFIGTNIYSHQLIPYWNAAVRLGFFLMVAYLLGRLKMHLLREQDLASTDDLTGLYNPRAFKEVAGNQLNLSRRYRHSFALAFIDIDNFKQVNDRRGHTEGDNVLRVVGRTLNRVVRSTDIVGRLGGDEFAVFMPEMDVVAAKSAFAKIQQELGQVADGNGWPIGFSIGVAVFSQPPATIDDAISQADHLMYRVKAQEKNAAIYEEFA